MSRLRKLLSKASVRGLILLLSGTIGAQVLSALSIPIISRLYTPAEFGIFAFTLALASIIAPAATLRFEGAAMLPESVEHVRALAWMGLISSLLVSLLFGLGIHISDIDERDGSDPIQGFAIWVGLFILGASLFNLFSQLALRKREYGSVAKRSLLRASITSVSQIGLGFRSTNSFGLFFGHMLGLFAGIYTLWRQTKEFWVVPRRSIFRESLVRYWRFPAIFAPSALLNAAGLHAPVIFFTTYYGLALGGQVGMAEKIAGLPIALIGAAVGQVITAEVSKLLRGGAVDLKEHYLKYTAMLLPIALIVAFGFGLLGATIIPWALGEEWAVAGTITQILSITFAVRLIANPLAVFRTLLQKSLANTVLDIIRVTLMGLAILITIAYQLPFETSLLFVYSALTFSYACSWIYGYLAVRGTTTIGKHRF